MINIKSNKDKTLGEFIRTSEDSELAALIVVYELSLLKTFDIELGQINVNNEFNYYYNLLNSQIDKNVLDTMKEFKERSGN